MFSLSKEVNCVYLVTRINITRSHDTRLKIIMIPNDSNLHKL